MWLKGNACSCSHPMWKSTSQIMITKMLWTISWVFVRSLPWAQHKRWIPRGSMGCVHTHCGRFTIEGCNSLNYILNIMEKIGEDNWKVGKISWIISQVPTQGRNMIKFMHNGILKYPIGKHAKKGMMVQMFQNGILKMNHLLFDELFKRRETCLC